MRPCASGAPTPGGGTVAALAGALGAALVQMVANLTIGKKKYAAAEHEMREAKAEADRLGAQLRGLMRRDSQAFERVMTAFRLPQATPDEVAALKLKVWLHPWLNILLIAAITAVVAIMLTSESGRAQVWTSLIATAVLLVFWPLVRRNLRRRPDHAPTTSSLTKES